MRFSAASIAALATLAVASPVDRRATSSSTSASVPDWVCKVWPSACSGSPTSTSSGSVSSSSSSSSSRTWTGPGFGSTPAVTETSTRPTYTPKSSNSSSPSSSGSSSSSATTTPSTSTDSSASSSNGTSSSGNEWADLHNNYRAKHQDTNNVEWDDDLAAGAKAHSEKCVFEHSSGEGDFGENLGMGSGLTASQTVDMWYGEVSDYGSYWGKEDVPMSVMHFTQVVWKGTTKVGCGVATCSDGNLVTCRYTAAGNMLGTFAENVGELKSS